MADIEQLAESVDSLKASFEAHRYICSNQIATAVYLAFHLRKPGAAASSRVSLARVGKTC